MAEFLKAAGPFLTGLLITITAVDAVMAIVFALGDFVILGIGVLSLTLFLREVAWVMFG
jgi:hypothetical protein